MGMTPPAEAKRPLWVFSEEAAFEQSQLVQGSTLPTDLAGDENIARAHL